MEPTTLVERCDDWNQNLAIDESRRIVKNVALTSSQSRNGYTYSEPALQASVALYEGKPVFLDHAQNRSRPHERSTRDLVGSIIRARYSEGRIHGDIRVLDTESGQTFLKLLEHESPGVGMSHVVRASRSSDGALVENIADVISVDVVVNPATTSTFRESTEVDASAAAEERFSALEAEISTLSQRCQELLNHNSKLTESLRRHEQRKQIHQLISESKLPDQAVTEFFIQQLESTHDLSTQQQMIEDRWSLIDTHGVRQPIAHSRPRVDSPVAANLDQQFINTIRHS